MICWTGALTATVEFWATVRVNCVACASLATPIEAPDGVEANVRSTVFGSTRTVLESLSPFGAVALSVTVTYDGKSWSGYVNVPDATPLTLLSRWVWQLPGFSAEQCWTSNVHVRLEAGIEAPLPSTADPEYEKTSLTASFRPAEGPVSVTVGGRPTVIVS